MICHKLSNKSDLKKLMREVGCTEAGLEIMSKKGKLNFFYLKHFKTPALNILKQDALSIGAELATPKGVITCQSKFANGILIASDTHVNLLIKKLKTQSFGLKDLSEKLSTFLNFPKREVKIMGVLNVNEDSFFQGSRFVGNEAIKRISQMIEDGAKIIDVGGVSSRPGSIGISCEEELQRVKPIIDEIYKQKLYEKATFSLDSYSPLCLEYAFKKGFKIANDITALQNDEVAKVCAKHNATVCLMHMQNDPKNMQKNPEYEDIIEEIDNFFTQRIQKAKNFGIKDIILDVGIGFGKTLQHNLELIKHQEHFLHHGYELLIGASRKSLIDAITPTKTEDRLAGTLILHTEAVKNGASIVRCHDVKEHFGALKVQNALLNI